MARVKDFYEDEEEYAKLLESASRGAQGNEQADDFVDDMIERFEENTLDAFISERQVDWLRKLADS